MCVLVFVWVAACVCVRDYARLCARANKRAISKWPRDNISVTFERTPARGITSVFRPRKIGEITHGATERRRASIDFTRRLILSPPFFYPPSLTLLRKRPWLMRFDRRDERRSRDSTEDPRFVRSSGGAADCMRYVCVCAHDVTEIIRPD